MKRRQKKGLFKALFWIVALFIIGVYAVPLLDVTASTRAFWVDVHTFFTDINTHVVANVELLLITLGALVGGYYFLVYKPRLKR